MKIKFKSTIRVAPQLFNGAFWTAAVLLIGSSMQAQNLFEADWGSGNIYEFTPGGTQSTFATGLSGPEGLAFNSAGALFEADYGSGNIYEFTPGGTQSTFATGLSGPFGLAFNSVGNLYVGTYDSIVEITPSGAQSTFATGLGIPFGLAFAPQTVPEPSTFWLLAVGLAALVQYIRRTRIAS